MNVFDFCQFVAIGFNYSKLKPHKGLHLPGFFPFPNYPDG